MKHLFFGGIHPKYNKEMSTGITSFQTITPAQVVIPMQQHIGAPCSPLVQVGDHVLLITGTVASKYCMDAPVDAAVVAILDPEGSYERP